MFRKQNLGALILSGTVMLAPTQLMAQEDAEATTTLDAVVVTASSVEESKREITVNATVIDAKAIQKSTAKNLGDLLRQSGFQTYSPGDGAMAQRIYMRGFGGSSMGNSELNYPVLVLLNGHRTGNADVGLIGLENVERVEILRGPGAVQYGSSAMGGVINIITKRGSEIPTINMELGIGSYGRFDKSLSFSGAKGGFEIAAGFKHSTRDDYKIGDDGPTWSRTGYDGKTTADIDLGYRFLENHRLGVHFNYAKIDDGKAPGSGISDTLYYPDQFADNNNRAYNTTFLYEGGTDGGLFNWKAAYTFGKIDNNSTGYVDARDGNPLVDTGWAAGPPFYPDVNNIYNTSSEMDQFQAQLTYDNGLLALTGGYDYVKYDNSTLSAYYAYNFISKSSSKVENNAGYLLAKVRLLEESLILTAGGRYDSYEVSQAGDKGDNNHFSPSAGIAWLPNDFLKLRAHYAQGFIVPTTSQLFGSSTYLANPGLKPAKSDTFEIGADLAWQYADASLTYFHSEYKDKIIGVAVSGTSGKFINTNLDGATIAGFEFNAGVDLGGLWGLDFTLRPYANLTYLTTRKNKDKQTYVPIAPSVLSDTPRWTAAYGLTFDHPDIGLTSTLNATYMGKRYTQDWSRAHAIAADDPWGSSWLEFGGFTVWDLSLDKALWDFEDKGKLGLRVEVNNLFDKDYAYTYDYPMPGRNFYVGLNYSY